MSVFCCLLATLPSPAASLLDVLLLICEAIFSGVTYSLMSFFQLNYISFIFFFFFPAFFILPRLNCGSSVCFLQGCLLNSHISPLFCYISSLCLLCFAYIFFYCLYLCCLFHLPSPLFSSNVFDFPYRSP